MKKTFAILVLLALATSCSDTTQLAMTTAENEKLQAEIENLKAAMAENASNTTKQITTFLTFQNQDAEEAMNFYVGLFDNSKVIDVQRYEAGGPAPEGSIMLARFSLNGKEVLCSDSFVKHAWNFTPGVSLFVDCQSAEEQDKLFSQLSENGQVMMPLNNYGFSQRFGFVEDRFGISWQLNLE